MNVIYGINILAIKGSRIKIHNIIIAHFFLKEIPIALTNSKIIGVKAMIYRVILDRSNVIKKLGIIL